MGIHEWSYDNDVSNDLRFAVPHQDKAIALADIKAEVELGFDLKQAFAEAQRCLNCDVETVFSDAALYRVRCLCRYLPGGLHHLYRKWSGSRAAHATQCSGG